MEFDRKSLSDEQLLSFYKSLLMPRMIEEKMLILLRQGRISKWFSGIGQEAIAVGSGLAMDKEEYILPMHRNLGIFTTRNIPLSRLFAQFQGKMSGFTKGRDRSFHFGAPEYNIVGMISHLGAQLGVADGIALANLLDENKQCVLAFTGDGGTSEGDFHEALNVAAVWDLPVIFLVEYNGYGLSTPNDEQFKFKSFTSKGPGYGVDALTIDGNNILEVYHTIMDIRQSISQNPRPFLLECRTFRMRGHEEASGTKYVPQELFDEWAEKDPLNNYRQYLESLELLTEEKDKEIRSEISELIDSGLETAFEEESVQFDSRSELDDIYRLADPVQISPGEATTEMRLVDAVSLGLRQSMERHEDLVVMGQDIAEYGGVFKVTEGFVELFGKERVRNTPICESAIVGASLGLSIAGRKSVMEMQFADFVSCGFNQIVNNLAKVHWRWRQNADVVVRMPTGAGVNAGPFHSQSNESWFFHTPGLKVVYPAFPSDAKGLLAASIEDPNPVMFFEHKALYRSIREEVPTDYYTLPLGRAKVLEKGEDVTIVSYGMGVHWALNAMEAIEASVELIDLRTLVPLDMETVLTSVRKTGKVLILHEDTITGGIGAEISAQITEGAFESLDAPVMRVGSMDTPVPFAADLERGFLANSRLNDALGRLLEY